MLVMEYAQLVGPTVTGAEPRPGALRETNIHADI
jgi:hypothetical protein